MKNQNHKILWAPWRKKYIVGPKGKVCVFCQLVKQKKDAQNLIVKRTKHAFAILNLYPYNHGHIMIIPKRHVSDFTQLHEREVLDFMRLQNEMFKLIISELEPHGLNLGANLGKAAGAGVLGHLHLHMVPRWNGDTNFMPMIGRTKVISESLDSLYRRLTA